MVFIHGGAFFFGMGSMPEYFGQPISTVGDVIYVSINYRLGPFGFLTTGDSEAPGNVGLMDQSLALKWVKNNIARFGGDADKITIFGESAGAASVSFHLVSKQSVGLFNQAIMQSGTSTSFFAYQRSMDYAKNQARDVAVEAGCPTVTTATMISCLQKISSRQLKISAYKVDMAYLPVVDGFFLHDKPENIIASGDFQKVDILIGSMKDEGTLAALVLDLLPNYLSKTAPPMNKLEFLDTYPDWVHTYGDVRNNNALKQAIETRYITPANPSSDFLQSFAQIVTDYTWLAPIDQTVRAHLNASTKVFMYEMTQVATVSIYHVFMFGPNWMGAAHADDIPFMFGNSWIPEVFYKSGKPKPEERMLSNTMMKYWTNFAKTGDPSGDGIVPHWPEFTLEKMEYKELSPYLPTKSGGVRQEYAKFWNEDARNLTSDDADSFFSSRGIEALIQAGTIVEQFKSSYD
ncbi:cholinesterase 1-like [Asterias rubens]|uniref:cholinesterase 1-like n=1 Tax=Asterias rubens TaxID=7604 RepID=UPI00145594E8|nr:cholinesterase 1-like [Asterias rubens]